MTNDKRDVLHGSLVLMAPRTLDTLGPQQGWGIARRIEQISGDVLELNQGTLYPALLRLKQIGWIASKWGTSDNNRRVEIIGRFLRPTGESL
jgi:DNA-binding PadR family transcriptional regulator